MKRTTYYEDDDIRVFIEDIQDQMFVHVAIFNANKSVIEKVKEKWGEVVMKVYLDGYDNLFTYTKDNRIVNMIGGAERIGQYKDFEVYKWELN